MHKLFSQILLFLAMGVSYSQDFPPAAGQPGSTAIAYDSSIIIGWALNCNVTRGFVQISDTSIYQEGSNLASYGNENDAIGPADNIAVSLGDGGYAILYFENSIPNVNGNDFAIFENAFSDTFLELAFVEASEDGIDYFRFPSISNTQINAQVTTFGELDTRYIYNLAGKYRALYGTPFDLQQLADEELLNINNIHYLKIIDVIGSIDEEFGSIDSRGHLVNDPWPTPFYNGGFDLDAVALLSELTSVEQTDKPNIEVFPNPATNFIFVSIENHSLIEIIDLQGNTRKQIQTSSNKKNTKIPIDIHQLSAGMYIVRINSANYIETKTFVKLNEN